VRSSSSSALDDGMFEKQLTGVLNSKLGAFLEGIDEDDVRFGVLNGDVRIRRVRVRTSALTKILDEPSVRVRYGFVDELRLQIPWRNLGKEAIKVTFHGVYVVAEIDEKGEGATVAGSESERAERRRAKALKATRRAVDAAEQAWLRWNPIVDADTLEAQDETVKRISMMKRRSGIAGLIDVALANIMVEVAKVHVRIEGECGDDRAPCGMGFVLGRVALTTVDEDMRVAFQVGGFAEGLRKVINLEQVGVYADAGSPSIAAEHPTGWTGMSDEYFVSQMSSVFGVDVVPRNGSNGTSHRVPKCYIFGPMRGTAMYTRRSPNGHENEPLHNLQMNINSVHVSIRSTQLRVFYAMYAKLRASRVRYTYASIRPQASVRGNVAEWWRFAIQGVQMHVNEMKRHRGLDFASSVNDMVRISAARERYVPLYLRYLRDLPPPPECLVAERVDQRNKCWPPKLKLGVLEEIDEIEESLPLHAIITFRTLAHSQYRKSGGVEEAVKRERSQRFHQKQVVKAVLGLAGRGAKNTVKVLKGITNPIRGIARAVRKRDSLDLVHKQKRARQAQREDEPSWQEDLETAMQLSKRSVELENCAITSSVEITTIVSVKNVVIVMVDDEMTSSATSEQEIFRINVNQLAFSRMFGTERTELRAAIRSLAVLSPEGTLVDMNMKAEETLSPECEAARMSQVDSWSAAVSSSAIQVQMIKGDASAKEDVYLKALVKKSIVHVLREPVDRVAQVAVRHQVTSEYLQSFIYEDETSQKFHTDAIEKHTGEFKVKPKVRLDVQMEKAIIMLVSDDAHFRLEVGKVDVKSQGADARDARNTFRVCSDGIHAGFVCNDWSINSTRTGEYEPVVLPMLDVPAYTLTVMQSLSSAAESPNLSMRAEFPTFDFTISPERVFKLRRLIKSLKPETNSKPNPTEVTSLDTADVMILQVDEHEKLSWIPGKITLSKRKHTMALDFMLIDASKGTRSMRVELLESAGASKLRSDLCGPLAPYKHIITIGEVVLSLDDLHSSLRTEKRVIITFDGRDDLSVRDQAALFNSWRARINSAAREIISGLVDSRKKLKTSKTQVHVGMTIHTFGLHVASPLEAHPCESDAQELSGDSDVDAERALASLYLTRLDFDIALASTEKIIHVVAEGLRLHDRYSSDAIGRECVAAVGEKKNGEFLSVSVTIRGQDNPKYDGLDKLIDIRVNDDLKLNLRRSTLLALISLRFRLRPRGFKLVKIMPAKTARVMVGNQLLKRIAREIRTTFSSVTATLLYDHTKQSDLPVGILNLTDVSWDTSISPPSRETSVSIGSLKLATGKMAAEGKWNVQPAIDAASTLALRNNVYDDEEEEDGANHSIELELASLDILVTPELKEIGPFFSFIRAQKPDHIEKFIHPCDRARDGFTKLKMRKSIKVDAPRITLPSATLDGHSVGHEFIIVPGSMEITSGFSSNPTDHGFPIILETTSINLRELDMTIVDKSGKQPKVSKITRKPIEVSISKRTRVDDRPVVVNEIDDISEIKVKPIFFDICGSDYRCVYDALNNVKRGKVRPNVQVKNPIRWGDVDPILDVEATKPSSLRSMRVAINLSSAQLTIFRLPMQLRPISTAKVVGFDVFTVRNLNRKFGVALDATVQVIGIDDDSYHSRNLKVKHVLYAGASNMPFARLNFREDEEKIQMRASLQHVELILRMDILLDTVRTFAPRSLGGAYLADMILPKDVKCRPGDETKLDDDLKLTESVRILADDPYVHGAVYGLNGCGHLIKFISKGKVVRTHSHHEARRKTMPRIIIGQGVTLEIDNVTFCCDKSALSKFFRIAPGGSYVLGSKVCFVADLDDEPLEAETDDLFESSPVVKAVQAKAHDRADKRITAIKKKKVMADVKVMCVHVVIGDVSPADQINVLFGLSCHAERDDHNNATMLVEVIRIRTKDTMKPPLLGPASMTLQLRRHAGVTTCDGTLTPINIELSPHRIHILKVFVQRIARAFAIAPLLHTSLYTCIWAGGQSNAQTDSEQVFIQNREGSNTSYTIWRPVVPAGYAMLADVVKSEGGAPEVEACLIRDVPALCAIPLKVEHVEGSTCPCFWRPIAPKGFVSLGLIASASQADEPSLDVVRCIREQLVTNSGRASTHVNFRLYGEYQAPKISLWQTNNMANGFICSSIGDKERPLVHDIRQPPGFQRKMKRKLERKDVRMPQKAVCSTAVNFKEIGFAQSGEDKIGFWEVVTPAGFVSTGDCLSTGDLPPLHACIFGEDKSIFQPPASFERIAPPRTYGASQKCTFWRPVAPDGYASVGYVVTIDDEDPMTRGSIACVREDLVAYIDKGTWTSENALWVDDKTSAFATHFWITNSSTKNFVMNSMAHGSSPDFGFGVFYMPDDFSNQSRSSSVMVKFHAPAIRVGVAFERRLQNQVLFFGELTNMIVNCTKGSDSVNISVESSLALIHRNQRYGCALEPIVVPWRSTVSLRERQTDITSFTPAGIWIDVKSSDKLEAIINQSSIADMMEAMLQLRKPNDQSSKIARMVSYEAVQDNVVINATGRSLWIRRNNDMVDKVLPGHNLTIRDQPLARENEGKSLGSRHQVETKLHAARGMADVFDDMIHHGDESLATSYLMFDVFSIEPVDGLSYPQLTIKTWDRRLQRYHTDSLPIGTLSGVVKVPVPHPLFHHEDSGDYVHNDDVDVIVELSYVGPQGDNILVTGVLKAPSEQQRRGWIGGWGGCWVTCEALNCTSIRVKLRARVVEGLTLYPICETQEVHRILNSPTKSMVKRTKANVTAPPLIVCRTNDLVKMWWSKDKSLKSALSAWTPRQPSKVEMEIRFSFSKNKSENEYRLVPFGTILVPGLVAPRSALMALVLEYEESQISPTAFPIDFEMIWAGDIDTVTFWKPVAPEGYVTIGNVVTRDFSKPRLDSVVCIREDLTEMAPMPPAAAWRSNRRFKTIGKGSFSIIRNGETSTGGWNFIKEKCVRSTSGEITSAVPPMRQLNQKLCIPSIHDESVYEIWFDTVSHIERLKNEIQFEQTTFIIAFSPNGPFEPIHLQLGASHVVHHKTHGLVFDAQHGKLLSYLACENETDDAILTKVGAHHESLGSPRSSTQTSVNEGGIDAEVEVFESERFYPFTGWSAPKDAIVNGRYSTRRSGRGSLAFFPDVKPPKGFKFNGPWRLDMPEDVVSANGWAYGAVWLTRWPPPAGSAKRKARATRRRRWVRPIVRVKTIEDFTEQNVFHNTREDNMEDVFGEVEADRQLMLPAFSRTESHLLVLKAKPFDDEPSATENLDDSEAFDMRWLLNLNSAARSYSNGTDFFILVKEHHSDIQDSASDSLPGMRLRIVAPLHITSSMHCTSQASVYADDRLVFSHSLLANEKKRVTSVNTKHELALHVSLFSDHHTLTQNKPISLRISEVGSTPVPNCCWLDVKGYPHVCSMLLIDATRTCLTKDQPNGDESQHVLNVTYRSVLLITNSSAHSIKCLAWMKESTSEKNVHSDTFVEIPSGQTHPGMFLKSSVHKVDKITTQEFELGICIDSRPVCVKVSARSEPVNVCINTASGHKLTFNCSATISSEDQVTSTWPTIQVTIQPVLAAINLTRFPLGIRSNYSQHVKLEPGSHPTPFSLDFNSRELQNIEDALNSASIQIADLTSHSDQRPIQWSCPLHHMVSYSGASWAIPNSANPSIEDINAFRELQGTTEDGEVINYVKPLIVKFIVERTREGCFRIFFTGGDGASLKVAPIIVKNNITEPVIVRQVKEGLVGTTSSRVSLKRIVANRSGMKGVGHAYALRAQSAMCWAWSMPSFPMKSSRQNQRDAAKDKLNAHKFLEVSTSKGEKCVIEINTLNAHFKGFMHLGELFFSLRDGKAMKTTIVGEWQASTFYIFLMHRTACFDSFSIRTEIIEQRRGQWGKKIQKEKHISATLAGFSITLVDRLFNDCVELLHTSIDDVCVRHGRNLVLGRAMYDFISIGSLQVDFTTPEATYPVFTWHDPSTGKFIELYATLSDGLSNNLIIHRFDLQTPKDGLVIRTGEELIWRLIEFRRILKTQIPGQDAKTEEENPTAMAKRQTGKDSLLHIVSLSIQPITFIVTFTPNSRSRPSDADAKIVAILTFASMQRLRLLLDGFNKCEVNMLQSVLRRDFVSSVKSKMIAHSLNIMTSMHTLTNVSTGLDAVSKAVETGFGVLESSSNLVRMPSSLIERQRTRNTIFSGVVNGLSRLSKGVAEGVVGLFIIPFKGIKSGGFAGGCKGCAKGITNLVAKPVAGVIYFASRTVEGVANTTRDVQSAAWDIVSTDQSSKAQIRRLPLARFSDGIIRRWDENSALAMYLMQTSTASSRALGISYCPGVDDLFTSMHTVFGNRKLILSNRRAMCVQSVETEDSLPRGSSSCLWYIAWSDVSSIWIENVVDVNVQINLTSEGDNTNLGSSKESKITGESSFTFRARTEKEAFEIEADMRRSWNKYLDSIEETE